MSALRKGKRRGKAPSRKAMRKRSGRAWYVRPRFSAAEREKVMAALRALASEWRAILNFDDGLGPRPLVIQPRAIQYGGIT